MDFISRYEFINELRRYILEKIRDGYPLTNEDVSLVGIIKDDPQSTDKL